MSAETAPILFADLGLPDTLLAALREVGYESPSPIQAATIPPLLEGRDVLGQAQTGTGNAGGARAGIGHHQGQAKLRGQALGASLDRRRFLAAGQPGQEIQRGAGTHLDLRRQEQGKTHIPATCP
jgi:hypothetical protein